MLVLVFLLFFGGRFNFGLGRRDPLFTQLFERGLRVGLGATQTRSAAHVHALAFMIHVSFLSGCAFLLPLQDFNGRRVFESSKISCDPAAGRYQQDD